MAKKTTTPFPYMTVLGIDMRRGAFHQYNVLGDDVKSVAHTVQNYTGASFDEDFYKKFANVVEKFVESNPSEEVRKIAFVVPDEVVALDNVRLPMLRSQKLIQNSLNNKLSEIYLNRDNLEVRTSQVEKNRQYCTYSVAAIQSKVLNSLYTVCSENKLYADVLTYASASTVTAVSTLNPKWKNENYLFLDIKDVYSRFIFVANGRCVGFYSLPFGSEFLSANKYVQEDMLFDHSMAELTVLNARERAKSKKLSVLEDSPVGEMAETVNLDAMMMTNTDWDDEDEDVKPVDSTVKSTAESVAEDTVEEVAVTEETTEETTADPEATEEVAPAEESEVTEEVATASEAVKEEVTATKAKVMAKKVPRKLPLFMQRPVPETAEDITKENFRVFVKWALSLIQSNQKLTAFGAPKFVCVNLHKDMQFVIDGVNLEEKENGLPFVRFDCADDDEDLAQNLELFGGLYGNNWHASAKF